MNMCTFFKHLSGSSRALALVGGLLLACQARPAAAQQQRTWDHAKCTPDKETAAECNPVFQVTAQAGEKISLTITNTCPDKFTYDVVPVPRPASEALEAAREDCTPKTRDVDITHDPQYGGYIIHIVKKEGTNPPLGSARVTIAVRTSEWRVGFAGGFTVNGLVDPRFALREFTVTQGTTTATRYRLVEQNDRKDEVGRSVASFVHLSHTLHPSVGVSFGLGVEPERTSDYYFGLSYLFGDRGALTIGGVTGNIRSLPAGRQVGDTVADANALANLGQRRVVRPFLGLSFRFLGSGQGDLNKPFQGQSPPGTQVTGGTAAPPQAPVQAKINILSGNNQTLTSGQKSGPIEVQVVDAAGKGLAGYTVRFALKEGAPGTQAVPTSAETAADGKVKTEVTLGTATAGMITKLSVAACKTADGSGCAATGTEIVIKTP